VKFLIFTWGCRRKKRAFNPRLGASRSQVSDLMSQKHFLYFFLSLTRMGQEALVFMVLYYLPTVFNIEPFLK
jgi:hypothetical protein